MANINLLPSLSDKIKKHFNRTEFQDLCFRLDSHIYDDLPGEALTEKINSFVQWCERRGEIPRLRTLLQELRPNAVWLRFLDSISSTSDPVIIYLIEESKKHRLPPIGGSVNSYLEKLDLILEQDEYNINSYETYLLVAAATLLHLLAANGKNLTLGQASADQIKDVLEEMSKRPNAPDGLMGLKSLIDEIVILINGRYELSIDVHQYRTVFIGNAAVRLGPLAIVGYLANLINLDEFSSPIPPAYIQSDTWEVRKAWWSRAYVTKVSGRNGGICLHYEVPTDHRDDYMVIIVSPLVQRVEQAFKQHGRLLRDTLGIKTFLFDPEVLPRDVPLIPESEWVRLKQELQLEQQRGLEEERLYSGLNFNRLHELYVVQTIEQARALAQNQSHEQAAQVYAQVSRILANDNALLQAQRHAIKAAEEYRKAGKEIEVVEQLISAAEFWQRGTRVPSSLEKQLNEAEELSARLGHPSLQAKIYLLWAWVSFASLSDDFVEQTLAQAQQLVFAFSNADDRARLLVRYATDYVLFAVVWEEWDKALHVLKEAIDLCPEHAFAESIALYQLLIKVNTELGKWGVIDKAYQHTIALLPNIPREEDREQRKISLDLDYAVSIARRGEPDRAYEIFQDSLGRAIGTYTSYELGIAYQNMQFWLLRSSETIPLDIFDNEVRRLDFHSSTEHLNQGRNHTDHATKELLNGSYRGALQHIRLALAHYWRDGNWIGRNEALRVLAHLNAATGRLLEAARGSVRVADSKLVTEYCRKLKETEDRESIDALVRYLSTDQFYGPENISAVKALGELVDVIPVSLTEQVYSHLSSLIQGSAGSSREGQLFRACMQTLGYLVPQLNQAQRTYLLELSLDKAREQAWTVAEPALELLDTLFIQASCTFDIKLYEVTAEVLNYLSNDEPLRDKAKRTEAHVARTAPSNVRKSIVSHIIQNPDVVDRTLSLVFLDEQVDAVVLEQAIEKIVNALNRQERVTEKDGKRTREWSLSANANPLGLTALGHLMPVSKADFVISGMLAAITNEHNEFNLRAGVIEAIAGLPLPILGGRAEEIVTLLIRIERDELPRSSIVDWQLGSQIDPFSNFRFNTGNMEQVRKVALHALGHLYSIASPQHQATIIDQLVRASRAASVELRQGAALLLTEIQSAFELPGKSLLALVALMHDSDTNVRRIAAYAAERLIDQNMVGDLEDSVLDHLLDMATRDKSSRVRQHAASGIRRLIQEDKLSPVSRIRGRDVLDSLASDMSFRVRSAAAG